MLGEIELISESVIRAIECAYPRRYSLLPRFSWPIPGNYMPPLGIFPSNIRK